MKPMHPKEQRLGIVNTGSSASYLRRSELHRIIEEAAAIARTPIALVSLVDQRHGRFAAAIGIEAHATLSLKSVCSQTVLHPGEALVILDARRDGAYELGPSVPGPTFVGFYIGIPLIDRAGYALGALCALDKMPRRKAPELSTLERLAQLAREAERLFAGLS